MKQTKCHLLALLLLPACLGGDGKATTPDAAPPDDPDSAVDPISACAEVMQNAPIANPEFPYADALPTATINTWDGQTIPTQDSVDYPGGRYRTLTADTGGNIHPGCTIEGLTYTPAEITGYPCAAKEYPFPDGVTEDTAKPIVILIHGNSDKPESWEAFLHENPGSITDFPADTEARPQLAERLPALGYRTIAVDMRYDRVDDPTTSPGGNPARNMDHGWAVPIAQALIKQIIINHPDRKISLVGFSLGVTVTRDALRRLWVEWKEGAWDINVYTRVQDVILASGAQHGVATYSLDDFCNDNWSMKGLAACQLGQRNQYVLVDFHEPLNGPPVPTELTTSGEFGGWYETPCADGDYAFGTRAACEGNTVDYTTITMKDIEQGTQQDPFVSEHSSRLYPLVCANNQLDELNDFDTSAYFLNGYFRHHFGSIRSEAGLAKIEAALGN